MKDILKIFMSPQGVLVIAAMAGLLLGDFLLMSPNRLLPGEAVALSFPVTGGLFCCLLLLLPFYRKAVFPFLVSIAFSIYLLTIGYTAKLAMENGGDYARVSPGGGFWIPALCLFLILLEGMMESGKSLMRQLGLMLASFVFPSLIIAMGGTDSLSVVIEFLQIREQFVSEVLRHLSLSVGATMVSVLFGVPLGYGMSVGKVPGRPVFYLLNLIQTIPGLALFSFLMTLLGFLVSLWPSLGAVGIRGIGWPPAFLALVMYGLFSVVRTSFESFSGIDPVHIHAAKGLGLSSMQVFYRLKLPLAASGIVNGVRLTLVMNIGMTTVTALIGAGGLGRFIFTGLGQAAYDLVLLGSLAVVGIALFVDISMRLVVSAPGKGGS